MYKQICPLMDKPTPEQPPTYEQATQQKVRIIKDKMTLKKMSKTYKHGITLHSTNHDGLRRFLLANSHLHDLLCYKYSSLDEWLAGKASYDIYFPKPTN